MFVDESWYEMKLHLTIIREEGGERAKGRGKRREKERRDIQALVTRVIAWNELTQAKGKFCRKLKPRNSRNSRNSEYFGRDTLLKLYLLVQLILF